MRGEFVPLSKPNDERIWLESIAMLFRQMPTICQNFAAFHMSLRAWCMGHGGGAEIRAFFLSCKFFPTNEAEN